MVMVAVADASIPAREEQEAVGESSVASGGLASPLHAQGTIRGPLLSLCNLKASPGICCKVGLCWRSRS